jgi:hypothetical protein
VPSQGIDHSHRPDAILGIGQKSGVSAPGRGDEGFELRAQRDHKGVLATREPGGDERGGPTIGARSCAASTGADDDSLAVRAIRRATDPRATAAGLELDLRAVVFEVC